MPGETTPPPAGGAHRPASGKNRPQIASNTSSVSQIHFIPRVSIQTNLVFRPPGPPSADQRRLIRLINGAQHVR